MDDKLRISPAALGAAVKGDLKNFIVASTPGGIEKQEAQGQANFVADKTLPIECINCSRDQLKKMGILFGEVVDDLFISCKLPKGWCKKPTEHSMWSDLLDEKGRIRAHIFYKAAFYDRHAHISLERRYKASYEPEDRYQTEITYQEREAGLWFGVVTDCGEIIYKTESIKKAGYESTDRLRNTAKSWLDKHYPNHEDSLAYWEDE